MESEFWGAGLTVVGVVMVLSVGVGAGNSGRVIAVARREGTFLCDAVWGEKWDSLY